MVGEPAADDAVNRARALPTLRVGLHVAVVRGHATLPSELIPDLVDARGRFATQLYRAGVNFFIRPGIRRQLEAEIRAQFNRFRATGLRLDHVNAHAHLHLHPTILGIIVKVGRDYGSPPVRVPHEPFLPSWRAANSDFGGRLWNGMFLAPWLALMRARLHFAGVATNDFVFGLNDTGRMIEPRVLQLLERVPHGVTEMYFHPALDAWPDMDPHAAGSRFQDEFAALISPAVKSAIRRFDITPCTYADVTSSRER